MQLVRMRHCRAEDEDCTSPFCPGNRPVVERSWLTYRRTTSAPGGSVALARNGRKGWRVRLTAALSASMRRLTRGRGLLGFARQREAIRQYAAAHGIELLEEYRDEGVSGTKELADRPGLAALLDRLESNGVRVVIIERADRLARDLMIQEVLVGQCGKIGVRILTADGVDLTNDGDDPTRRLIRQVLGAVSEFEKRVIVLKLRAARERKRARGERVRGREAVWTLPRGTGARQSDAAAPAQTAEGSSALRRRHRRAAERGGSPEPRRPRVVRAVDSSRAQGRVVRKRLGAAVLRADAQSGTRASTVMANTASDDSLHQRGSGVPLCASCCGPQIPAVLS